MAVNTILLDFTVKSSEIHNGVHEDIIIKVLNNYLPHLDKIIKRPMEDGGYVVLLTGSRGSFVTIRGFPEGLITINIEYYKKDSEDEILSFQQKAKLEKEIVDLYGCKKYDKLPALRRGGITRYFPTTDERILEYDIDEVVFEETSPYQKVQIVHSKTFGNMLILDGLENLSDHDLIYTETLMQRGRENYSGKEIAILGGGDGALLHELLKENPKLVLMFELDELVIRVCRQYMRKCCGDVLDSMKGPNYEIILGDCMKSLEAMIREGKKFDYIFGDLTDIPVSLTPHNEDVWDLNHIIIKKSLQILKPNGKYLTHCCGAPCAVKIFEEQITAIDKNIAYSKTSAFIPSFLENWLFYQIWKEEKN